MFVTIVLLLMVIFFAMVLGSCISDEAGRRGTEKARRDLCILFAGLTFVMAFAVVWHAHG